MQWLRWLSLPWRWTQPIAHLRTLLEWLGVWPLAVSLATALIAAAFANVREWDPIWIFLASLAGFGAAMLLAAGVLALRDRVRHRPAATPAPGRDSSSIEDLRLLRNDVLAAKVIAHANAMRAYEANFRASEPPRISPPLNASNEQLHAMWDADMHARWQRDARYRAEVSVRFVPDALAMWQELESRLGVFGPLPGTRTPTLFGPNRCLVGPDPVTDAANYLDQLARKLP